MPMVYTMFYEWNFLPGKKFPQWKYIIKLCRIKWTLVTCTSGEQRQHSVGLKGENLFINSEFNTFSIRNSCGNVVNGALWSVGATRNPVKWNFALRSQKNGEIIKHSATRTGSFSVRRQKYVGINIQFAHRKNLPERNRYGDGFHF